LALDERIPKTYASMYSHEIAHFNQYTHYSHCKDTQSNNNYLSMTTQIN
jgi:hypothetical protein